MTVTALPLPATALPPAPVYQPAPAGAPAEEPRVFSAIAAVMRDAMPVGKNQKNTQQNYKFRGIDDVMSAMAGPMRRHGVFILPTIADHAQQRDGKMTRTLITMRYSIYGPAGDCLVAEVPGEASDFADKSMNKAQSAALKYLLFTLFMLPVDGRSIDDADRDHPTQAPAQRADRAQRRPRRNYVAEAESATEHTAVQALWREAKAAGAPTTELDQITAAGRKLAPAPERTAVADQAPEPAADAQRPMVWTKPAVAAEAEAAEQRLRLAASAAGLPTLDADFERVHGMPIAEAPAAVLDQFRQQIESAAGGAR